MKHMIIFRYLSLEYIKVFIFSTFSFLAILMTTRLEEVARFASLGANKVTVILFSVYQLSYILPIVIPISGLLASVILMQRMSANSELTALRASGMSIREILSPILIIALFLMLFNFYIVSEVATESHLKSRVLKRQLSQINPLAIIHNKHLMQHKDLYFQGDKKNSTAEKIKDFFLLHWNSSSKKLSLLTAEELAYNEPTILGKDLTLITGLGKRQEEGFDDLYIENLQNAAMDVAGFSLFLKQKVKKVHDDFLKLSLLIHRIQKDVSLLDGSPKEAKEAAKRLNVSFSDIFRRFSIALAAFSFTLLGTAFGIVSSREKNHMKIVVVILLASFYLIAFFIGKAFEKNVLISGTLFLLPNAIIIAASFRELFLISRGGQ